MEGAEDEPLVVSDLEEEEQPHELKEPKEEEDRGAFTPITSG